MINNIKKSVCKANEDFIFGTDFADKMGWNELDDISTKQMEFVIFFKLGL